MAQIIYITPIAPQNLARPGGKRSSDLKSHANDRLSNRAQAGVAVAGVTAHELVGVIDRERGIDGDLDITHAPKM